MVAINMEMPTCCVTYTSENDNYTACPFYKICTQRETIKTNYKPSDCPLIDIEERKVGKWKESPSPSGSGLIGYKCSNCGKFYPLIEGLNYCPNCGCHMTKEE